MGTRLNDWRKQLTEKLSKISASRLSPLDARALEVINRHLRDNFQEQFNDQNALPEHCQDAQRQDLSMESLEGALHACFIDLLVVDPGVHDGPSRIGWRGDATSSCALGDGGLALGNRAIS